MSAEPREHQTSGAYKVFPPGWSQLHVPLSSRRAALMGLALYASCKPRAVLVQRLAWTLVAAFGPRALPGRSRPWVPPLAAELWSTLLERWRTELGPFDSIAIYQRSQTQRTGLALLLIGEHGPRAFVKLQQGERPGLDVEAEALRLVEVFRPSSFRAPALLGRGTLADWSYVAMSPLPPQLHAPPRDPPLRRITDEISAALAGLPRPADAPSHWTAMHGDLTPWNLRRFRRQGLAIVDWEDASFGPSGADETLFRASAAALRSRGVPAASVGSETIDFWCARVRARDAAQARDARLSASLLDALERMRRDPDTPR
jgi:hypothetical protein